uniref:Major capsid protein N-terminal domain-containing protein n=1 Tax=viral metagenome TaxID=1070528 RepID=A0A6C0M0T7_9ZZZZ
MTTSAATVQICHVDLATFSELESFIYGGRDAMSYFLRSVQKSNWFSFVPIRFTHLQNGDFAADFTCSLNRAPDYILNVWSRVRVPQIQLNAAAVFADASIAWTRNFMHNLIETAYLHFNTLPVQKIESGWLDANYYFRVPGSKNVGYRNMIGDIAAMTTPVLPGVALGTGGWFNCPLPFWFAEDSGVALPTAALPFNDIEVQYRLRSWRNLLILNPGTAGGGGAAATYDDVHMTGSAITVAPRILPEHVQTWGHGAVVHNDERVRMGQAPRDILIHQVQSIPRATLDASALGSQTSTNLRFSHAVTAVFYMARNISSRTGLTTGTDGPEHSNYTTEPNYAGLDPLAESALIYENTIRFGISSDYSSLVCPWYYSSAIPDDTGLHMLTYSLNPFSLDPMGSTNFSKLANVQLISTISPAAVNAAAVAAPVDQTGAAILDYDGATVFPQRFELMCFARNHNIGRVSGGSFGHPLL